MESRASSKRAAHHIFLLILAQMTEKQHLSNLFCNLSDKMICCINYPMLLIYMEVIAKAKTD